MKRLVLLCVFLCGCAGCPPTPARPEAGVAEAGGHPITCQGMCDHGAELGCTWAGKTPNGATCVEVCANAMSLLQWNLACRVVAVDCAAVEACER